MNILVCIKQVPDTTEVKLSSRHTLQRDYIAQVTNLADESALELALALRDEHGGQVTAVSMGPKRAEGTLREALARGADKALLLCDPAFAGADTLITAKCLQAAAEQCGAFDLILCGRQAVDGETGQVGPMLAALLDVPCIANVTAVHIDKTDETACAASSGTPPILQLRAEQLTEAGTVAWRAAMPAVITLCEWSYRLRLPTVAGLRHARTAQVSIMKPADIGMDASKCGLVASPTRVVRVHAQPVGVRPCQKLLVADVLSQLEKRGAVP